MKFTERLGGVMQRVVPERYKEPLTAPTLPEYIQLLKREQATTVKAIPSRNQIEGPTTMDKTRLTFEYYVAVDATNKKGRKLQFRQSCQTITLGNPLQGTYNYGLMRYYDNLRTRTVLSAKELLGKIKAELPSIHTEIWVRKDHSDENRPFTGDDYKELEEESRSRGLTGW